MMRRQILKTVVVAVVSLILFNACSKDPENYPENLIVGTWKVTSNTITINTPENEYNRLLIQAINDHPYGFGWELNVGSVWVFDKSHLTRGWTYEPCGFQMSSDGSTIVSFVYDNFESKSSISTYEVSDDILRVFATSGNVAQYDIEKLSRNKLVLVREIDYFSGREYSVNYTVRAVFEKQ